MTPLRASARQAVANLNFVGELARTIHATSDGGMIAMTKEMASGIHEVIVELHNRASNNGAKYAMPALTDAIHADPDYAWSWHCNLAMAFVDEGMARDAANFGAARFMQTAFGLDTSKHEHFDAARSLPDSVPAEGAVAWMTVHQDTTAFTARIHDVSRALPPGTYDLYATKREPGNG